MFNLNTVNKLMKVRFNIFLSFFILSLNIFATENVKADGMRDELIDQQMDAVEARAEHCRNVGWDDVCYIDPSVPQFGTEEFNRLPLQEKQYAVSQALDEWDTTLKRHEKAADPGYKLSKDESEQIKTKKENPRDKFFYDKYAKNLRTPENSQTARKHTVKVDTQLFRSKYVEPEVMKQKGVMWGVAGQYTYRPQEASVLRNEVINAFRLDGMMAWGDFDYEAEAVSQTGLQIGKEDDMYEIRGILGREYVGNDQAQYMIYSGLGYRYLNDEPDEIAIAFNGSTVIAYQRESQYYYFPIGFEYFKKMENNWDVTANIEYDWFLKGEQTSRFTDGDPFTPGRNDDVVNPQHHGYGFRGSVQMAKKTEKFDFFFEPFFRYWDIEDSDLEDGFFNGTLSTWVEPSNYTMEMGGKMGVHF